MMNRIYKYINKYIQTYKIYKIYKMQIMENWYPIKVFWGNVEKFRKVVVCKCICVFLNVLYYRLLLLMRCVIFCIYEHIWKIFHFLENVQKCAQFSYEMFFLQKMYMYWYFLPEILLVFSSVICTGIFGGNYYWYGRRKYYWYGRRKYYWYFRR